MKNIIWWLLAFVLIALGLASCSTLPKRIEKAKGLMASNPNEFAGLAGTLYPPKTVYVKGKDSIRLDTVREEKVVTDTIYHKGDTIYRSVKCPPSEVRTRTIIRTDTLKTGNTARELFLANSLIKLDNDLTRERTLLEEAESGSKTKTWVMIGIGLLLLASAYFNLRKKSSKDVLGDHA